MPRIRLRNFASDTGSPLDNMINSFFNLFILIIWTFNISALFFLEKMLQLHRLIVAALLIQFLFRRSALGLYIPSSEAVTSPETPRSEAGDPGREDFEPEVPSQPRVESLKSQSMSLEDTDTKAVKLQQPARMRKVVACFREFCF